MQLLETPEQTSARFETLARQWKAETSHLSSIAKRSLNLNYQKIIGMGPGAVPLILSLSAT